MFISVITRPRFISSITYAYENFNTRSIIFIDAKGGV